MTQPAITPAPADALSKSFVGRVVGVFFSPRATFADIAARPASLGVLDGVMKFVARGVQHAVRREQRQAGRRCEIAQRVILAFLAAAEMTLDFDEDVFLSKRAREPLHARARAIAIVASERTTQV